jgi:hypothetical protein
MVTIEEFRQLALSLPGAIELPHFELTSFRVNKKIFATLDAQNHRACLMLSAIEQSVFTTQDKAIIYPVPNKWGQQGATYVKLTKVHPDLLKDALTVAYEGKAAKPKK